MLKTSLYFFWLTVVSAQTLVTVEPETAPFWVTKAKISKKVFEEGEVVVSVTDRKPVSPPPSHQLYLQGAGLVKAPLERVDATARDFSNYPKMSSYVKSAEFDASTSQLRMTTEAFGYQAHLKMKIEFRKVASSEKQIRFKVLEGVFKDMNGVLRLEEKSLGQTMISFTGVWSYETLPIPRFFVEFGMEVALRIMATRMRAYVMEHQRAVPQ